MKKTAPAFPSAMESVPQRIWNKFKAIIPHRSKDAALPQGVVGGSSDQTVENEAARARPSTGVFYAAGPSAGLDVTTVAFSRDLSQPGITSHPVFVIRNLDETSEDENASLRSSVDLNSSGPSYGVCSTCAPPFQDFSEPRIKFYPILRQYEEGSDSEESIAFGGPNYSCSGSRQSADRSIWAPRRKGTPPLLFGNRWRNSFDSNLTGLMNSETITSATFPTSISASKQQSIPQLPFGYGRTKSIDSISASFVDSSSRFDTKLIAMELRLLTKRLNKMNPDGVDLSTLHAKQDALLLEAISDTMPVVAYKSHQSLTNDMLFPIRPKSAIIIPKRLSVPLNPSSINCLDIAKANGCQ